MPKTTTKKARFLHAKSREYRDQRKVADDKTRANRLERRTLHQRLAALAGEAGGAPQARFAATSIDKET